MNKLARMIPHTEFLLVYFHPSLNPTQLGITTTTTTTTTTPTKRHNSKLAENLVTETEILETEIEAEDCSSKQ